jgi:hypothetical protein
MGWSCRKIRSAMAAGYRPDRIRNFPLCRRLGLRKAAGRSHRLLCQPVQLVVRIHNCHPAPETSARARAPALIAGATRSGNRPGIQREASAAGNTRRSGAREPSAVSTPRSVSADTMRRAWRATRSHCQAKRRLASRTAAWLLTGTSWRRSKSRTDGEEAQNSAPKNDCLTSGPRYLARTQSPTMEFPRKRTSRDSRMIPRAHITAWRKTAPGPRTPRLGSGWR